jgi:hypothetical protein
LVLLNSTVSNDAMWAAILEPVQGVEWAVILGPVQGVEWAAILELVQGIEWVSLKRPKNTIQI